MSRFYVRIEHDTTKDFHSFIVRRDGLQDAIEYAALVRDRVMNEHNGAINIVKVGAGHTGTAMEVQEQFDNVALLYVDAHVAAVDPANTPMPPVEGGLVA